MGMFNHDQPPSMNHVQPWTNQPFQISFEENIKHCYYIGFIDPFPFVTSTTTLLKVVDIRGSMTLSKKSG